MSDNVGAVDLEVLALPGTFARDLTKIASEGAKTAGKAASAEFMKSFVAEMQSGSGAFTTMYSKSVDTARSAGLTAGKAYSTAFAEASAKSGAVGLSSSAESVAKAEEAGVASGRAFSRGAAVGQSEGSFARGLEQTFKGVETGAAASGTRAASGFIKNATTGLLPLAGLIAAAYSVKLAGDFEQQTNVLVTAAGEQEANLSKVKSGILDIASTTGTSWKEVTQATYDADKAGYTYANGGLKVVKAAAQGAREEGANLGTVTQGLTTTMINFGKAASNPVQVVDALKRAAGESKTTFEQFTAGLGNFESRASKSKISLADVLAVYSQTINAGNSAQKSSQNVGSTITALSNPLKPALALMGQLGIDSVDLVTKLGDGPGGRGLAGTIDYLSQKILKSMGPSGLVLLNTFNQSKQAAAAANTEYANLSPPVQKLADEFEKNQISSRQFSTGLRTIGGEAGVLGRQFLATYTQAHGFQAALKAGGPLATTYQADLLKLTGGQQGLTVALANSGGAAGITQDKIANIGSAARDTDKNVQGWALTQHNFNTELGQFQQTAIKLAIELGTELLPPLKSILSTLAAHPAILRDVAIGLGVVTVAWTAMKLGSIIGQLAGAAAGMLGLGLASDATAIKIDRAGLAAQKSFLGITGIGTAVARLAGGAALATVGSALYSWYTAASKAQQAVDKIQATVTDPNNVTQLAAANKALSAQYDQSHKATSGIGGILKSTLNTIDFGATGPSGFQSIDTANKSIDQLRRNQGTIDNISIALSQLHNKFGLTTADLEMLATKGNIGFGTTVSSLVKGEAAFDKMYGAELRALPVNTSLAKGLDDTGTAAGAASAKVDALSGILNGVLTKQAGALQATDAFQKGLNDLADTVDSSSKSLAGNSDAAINNRAAITNLAIQANTSAAAYGKAHNGTVDYTKALNYAIPQIEAQAEALGFSKSEVEGLIAKLGLIPPKVTSDVSVNGVTSARDQAAELLAYLQALARAPFQAQVDVQVQQFGSATGATIAAATAGGPGGRKADGGYITGPGTSRSDSIPMHLSNGEFVINAAATATHRQLLESINGGAGEGGTHFAAGGIVGAADKAEVAAFLKSLAAVVKLGVSYIEKSLTAVITAGTAATAAAVKEGNGPLQKALEAQLKSAEGVLYGRSVAAVRDGVVSPQEAASVSASSKIVTALTAQLVKLNTVNATLVNSLTNYVQSEQQYRDSLQTSLAQNAGFSDIAKLSGSPGELVSGIASKLSDLKSFVAKIGKLRTAGFSAAIIREVAADGIVQGGIYADVLLQSTATQVGQINGLEGQLTAAQLGDANAITKATGKPPGTSNAAAVAYVQQAIFTPGADITVLVSKAEFATRTGVKVMDTGGMLHPGRNVVDNFTGGPERVLDRQQTADWERGVRSGGGVQIGSVVNHYNGVDLTTATAQSNRDLALALRGV